MKKPVVLLLTLVLVVALAVAGVLLFRPETTTDATTETQQPAYIGAWELTLMTNGETSFNPRELGLVMTLDLQEDGVCTITTADNVDEGSWAATETGVSVTDASGTIDLTYADGALTMEADGVHMAFTPAAEAPADVEYAKVMTNLTVADFNGRWVLDHVETSYGIFSLEQLGSEMTLVLADGQCSIEVTKEGEVSAHTATCQINETDIGTVMSASIIDPATGEPDGSGLTLLMYDDGQLVWYEYEQSTNYEYFYCFNKVAEEAE